MLVPGLNEFIKIASLPQSEWAATLDSDTNTDCKMWKDIFVFKKKHASMSEDFYHIEKDSLAKIWLAEKVNNVVKDEPIAKAALTVVNETL